MWTDIIKNIATPPLSWFGEHFPVTMVRLRYLARFHRLPNLKNPSDLNEKILYLKLFTDTSEWTRLADKYKVRDYVRSCGLERILIPLYGAWERVEDIPFDELPQTFMLKANNGDGKGTNLKIDKAQMTDEDWAALKKTLNKWLSQKHIGALSAEPQYKGIKPMIIAEEVLPPDKGQPSLIDYKLWCLDGEPHSFLVCSDRKASGHDACLSFYDLQWNLHPERLIVSSHYQAEKNEVPRPMNLKEMIEIGRILTKGFPEVRLDLYESKGKVFFGEMTFTALGGMMNNYSPEYLQEMGKLVTIKK